MLYLFSKNRFDQGPIFCVTVIWHNPGQCFGLILKRENIMGRIINKICVGWKTKLQSIPPRSPSFASGYFKSIMTRMKKFNKEKIASLKQRNINKNNFCRNFEFYHLRVILGLYKTLNKKTLDFVWKGGGYDPDPLDLQHFSSLIRNLGPRFKISTKASKKSYCSKSIHF